MPLMTQKYPKNILIQEFDVSGEYFARGDTELSSDTWYHFAITYDNESVKIYVNGTISSG